MKQIRCMTITDWEKENKKETKELLLKICGIVELLLEKLNEKEVDFKKQVSEHVSNIRNKIKELNEKN